MNNFSDSFIIGNCTELQVLNIQRKESLRSAYAEGTKKNMKTQWKSFFLFCFYFHLTPLPCDLDTLCLFAQFLSRSFKSVDSIRNYLNGVKVLHLILDFSFTHFESFYFKLFMKGLKRCNPHTVKAALPITPDILLRIRETLNFEDNNMRTYWCLSLFSFFLMCRKSNLVGKSNDISTCLKRKDISVFDDYLIVHFSWSKTIQFGERYLDIPILKKKSCPLCPVSAFKDMCSSFPVSLDFPAFVIRHAGKIKPVSYGMFQDFIKKSIMQLGINPQNYSSHSFRRGGATWAFKCGVPADLIQLQGDWRSDAYKLYLKYDLEDKISVSSKMMSLL